jgi:septal ring factor EnvC (AmiA/AmiB activator)
MLDGFGFVFGQVAGLLLAGVGFGLLIGRYLLPRRARGQTPGPPGVPAPTGTQPEATVPAQPNPDRPLSEGDVKAQLTYVHARLSQSESRRAELEARLAEAQAQLSRTTTGLAGLQDQAVRANSELEQAQAELARTQAALGETRRQLSEADAEVVRLRLQTRDLVDRKEMEMGRLESGAIAALESAIETHQKQVTKLEERLQATERAVAERDRELAQLQAPRPQTGVGEPSDTH